MSAPHGVRELLALAHDPRRGEPGEEVNPAGSLVHVALLLNRSVHAVSDDDARTLRDAAHAAGASAEMVAAALRLRDRRVAEDVQVIEL